MDESCGARWVHDFLDVDRDVGHGCTYGFCRSRTGGVIERDEEGRL